MENNPQQICWHLLPEKPTHEIPGHEWYPMTVWQLRPTSLPATSTPKPGTSSEESTFSEKSGNVTSSSEKTLGKLILQKMKGNVDKPKAKRRKVDFSTKVITDD